VVSSKSPMKIHLLVIVNTDYAGIVTTYVLCLLILPHS
jgi:hypothetical protein